MRQLRTRARRRLTVAPDFRKRGARHWLVCCGLLAGCLNPQPDLQPTVRPGGPAVNVPVDVRPETCDDNPLLAGCPSNASAPPRPPSANEGSGPTMSGLGGGAGSGGMPEPPDAGPGVGDAASSTVADTFAADAGAGDDQDP
jgi:hypothetical protein